MKNFDKLYLYIFTAMFENTGDSKRTVKVLDTVLNKTDDELIEELQKAMELQKMIKTLKSYNLTLSDFKDMEGKEPLKIPKGLLKELKTTPTPLIEIKIAMDKLINTKR